jgi:hypothetical protein
MTGSQEYQGYQGSHESQESQEYLPPGGTHPGTPLLLGESQPAELQAAAPPERS